jgi:hypothetical protein
MHAFFTYIHTYIHTGVHRGRNEAFRRAMCRCGYCDHDCTYSRETRAKTGIYVCVCMYVYVCICIYVLCCVVIVCVYVCMYVIHRYIRVDIVITTALIPGRPAPKLVYMCMFVCVCMYMHLCIVLYRNCMCLCMYVCHTQVYTCGYRDQDRTYSRETRAKTGMFVYVCMYVCMYTKK